MTSTPLDTTPPRTSGTAAAYVHGMERLVTAVQELSLARSLPEVQRIVRTAARELTGADGATFVLRDDGKCHYADEDAIAPLWKGSRFPMELCISGWAMLNKRAAIIPDIYVDDRIPHAAYRPTFVKSLVMVPIRKLDPIGAIGNYWASEREPTAEEVHLLQALADATSVAMENMQVYAELEQRVQDRTAALEKANEDIRRISLTDVLTGLHNRRGFYQFADAMLKTARRQQSSCLLAFVDVDGLKAVNDQLGHDAGDALIAAVAEVLRQTLRSSDLVARMGGDEFAVLACEPGTDERVLKQRLVAACKAFNDRSRLPYTMAVSIGVLQIAHDNRRSLDELLSTADQLMYDEKRARRGGRDSQASVH